MPFFFRALPDMRTNIDIDSRLVKRVMKIYPNLKTKRDVVNFALRETIETHKDRLIIDLFGADLVDPNYSKEILGNPASR